MRRLVCVLLATLLILAAGGTGALALGDSTITVEGVMAPVNIEQPHFEVSGFVLIGNEADFAGWSGQEVFVTGRASQTASAWMRPTLQVDSVRAVPATAPAPVGPGPQPTPAPVPPVVAPKPPISAPEPPAPPQNPDVPPARPSGPLVPMFGSSAFLLFGVLTQSQTNASYYSLNGVLVTSASINVANYVGEKVAATVLPLLRPAGDQGPRVFSVQQIWTVGGDLGIALGRGGLPYTEPPRPIHVMVDGRLLRLDAPALMANGRTLVPIRTVTEALGAEVAWDGELQMVTVRLGSRVVTLSIGWNQALVTDGEQPTQTLTIDAAPVIVDGRTEVPLRLLAEAFGFQVDWDAGTYTVTIH